MKENLNTTKYCDGSAIPNVTDNNTWSKLKTGAYCNYDNSSSNAATYGKLYNWYAVNDSRKLCPTGWHVPSDAEWKTLEMSQGMSQVDADKTGWRGTDEGGKLKETGTSRWKSPNTKSTNTSGFSALPGGFRYSGGKFDDMGSSGYWCSLSESGIYLIWFRFLNYDSSSSFRFSSDKEYGFSVRCIMDRFI